MIATQQWRMWRYYFLDLPMFSCGIISPAAEKRLRGLFGQEMDFMKKGVLTLCDYLEKIPDKSEIDTFIQKAFWVKIVREGDAYTSLFMSKRKFSRYFKIEGIKHLQAVMDKNRPIILLSGHTGSFYTAKIALSHSGIAVFPIAREVDYSPETPLARSLYEELNYKITELRYLGEYIFTDNSGRLDRKLINIVNSNGILWTAIDLPKRLYAHKRAPITFLGHQSSLPSGLIDWASKKNAIFMTAWNTIERMDNHSFMRKLHIDEAISDGLNATEILQIYADRFSELIYKQPYQWMGLQIIRQFDESEETQHG